MKGLALTYPLTAGLAIVLWTCAALGIDKHPKIEESYLVLPYLVIIIFMMVQAALYSISSIRNTINENIGKNAIKASISIIGINIAFTLLLLIKIW